MLASAAKVECDPIQHCDAVGDPLTTKVGDVRKDLDHSPNGLKTQFGCFSCSVTLLAAYFAIRSVSGAYF
jgi:hypothetical protein